MLRVIVLTVFFQKCCTPSAWCRKYCRVVISFAENVLHDQREEVLKRILQISPHSTLCLPLDETLPYQLVAAQTEDSENDKCTGTA